AAHGAAPGKDLAAVLGGHAGAETMAALAHQIARLKSTLHGCLPRATRARSSCLYDVDLKHGARTPQGTGRQSWSAYRECARSSQSNSLGAPAFLPCASIAASPPG